VDGELDFTVHLVIISIAGTDENRVVVVNFTQVGEWSRNR
jgi:hypothetical protein